MPNVHNELFVPHRVDGVANNVGHVVLWRLIDAQHTVRVAVRPWNSSAFYWRPTNDHGNVLSPCVSSL